MALKRVGEDIYRSFESKIKGIEGSTDSLSIEIADLFIKRLKSNIRKNKFGFELKQTTLRSRKSRGVTSVVPLIDSGEYIKSIRRQGAKVDLPDGKHKKGLSYKELWNILEYGRKDLGIPAFPVWRMTYEEIKPEVETLIKKHIT